MSAMDSLLQLAQMVSDMSARVAWLTFIVSMLGVLQLVVLILAIRERRVIDEIFDSVGPHCVECGRRKE